MALSLPSNRVSPRAVAALVAVLGALALPAFAPARAATGVASVGNCREAVEMEGTDLGANFKKGTTELTDVKITGCDMVVEAKRARATSPDLDDSRWTLDGNVRITAGQQQSKLHSDQAVIHFKNNQIERATFTGSPAEFEQKRKDSDAVARGHAKQILYEFSAGTVTLSDDAWLSDGSKEIKSAQIVYDIKNQGLAGTSKSGDASKGGERVKITINPKALKDDGKSAAPAPPTGQATPGTKPAAAAPAPATP